MLYGNDVTNVRGCAFRRCKLKLRKCAVREQSSRGGEEGARERARALIKAHCNKEHFLFTLPRSGSGRRAGFGFGFSSVAARDIFMFNYIRFYEVDRLGRRKTSPGPNSFQL